MAAVRDNGRLSSLVNKTSFKKLQSDAWNETYLLRVAPSLSKTKVSDCQGEVLEKVKPLLERKK
eukprot:1156602-Pelagomonas_calceolata.AAC.3